MKKTKRFLRANASRIAIILCAVGCLLTLAALVFSAANDYSGVPVLIQPIAVGRNTDWLAAYRPVTFGDCPTLPPPEMTTVHTTVPQTETTEKRQNASNVPVTDATVYVSYEEEPIAKAGSGGKSLGYFTCTAYCGCYSCSEGYGNMTATGVYARANHTIAVDPSVIPYGTWVIINGVTYKAEDCGGGINGRMIDIYFEDHAATEAFGVRTCEVFLA